MIHFSSTCCWGGRGGVSDQLSSAELTAAGLNHNRKETQNGSGNGASLVWNLKMF